LLHICGTLDYCCIGTHSINKEGDLQIYFGVVFRKMRHLTHRPTSYLAHYTLCSFSAREMNTNCSTVWWVILWASVACGYSFETHNICCGHTWSSNQSEGGAILAFSSSLNQIPHQKGPEISLGIFSPT